MQISKLSAQPGLRLELADWYREEISVPFRNTKIDLSPRTDDRLSYCTNTRSIPSKFIIPDLPKQSKILNNEHTKHLYSPSSPIILTQRQKSFPSVMSEIVHQVLLRMYNKFSQRKKPAKYERTSRDKNSKRNAIAVPQMNQMEAKKWLFGIRKRFTTQKSH